MCCTLGMTILKGKRTWCVFWGFFCGEVLSNFNEEHGSDWFSYAKVFFLLFNHVLLYLFQLGQPQPHDGAATAAALQWVSVSVVAGYHCPCGTAGGTDSTAWRPQLRWRHGHPAAGPHQEGQIPSHEISQSLVIDHSLEMIHIHLSVHRQQKVSWLAESELNLRFCLRFLEEESLTRPWWTASYAPRASPTRR